MLMVVMGAYLTMQSISTALELNLFQKKLFRPNEYKNNDKIILKYFQLKKLRWKKTYCVICGKYRNL